MSGPSKSGKTVLIKKVIPADLLINISGAAIKTPENLWDQVLYWMGSPGSVSSSTSAGFGIAAGGKASGEAGIPIVAQGKAEAHVDGSLSRTTSTTEVVRQSGFHQVIREISGSDYIVFIDDFHYIPRDVQTEIGRQIKAIAESGVRIAAASVPHRSDDVVRSNPELSGRVGSIKIDYWSTEDLALIAKKGFPELNVDLATSVIDTLTKEAFGTPQLMQALCLNLCLELGVRESGSEHKRWEVPIDKLGYALERTADLADYSSVVQGLHTGPKERGTERKQFKIKDGSTGDVYRCILLAMRQDPPRLSFTYDDLVERTRTICKKDSPVGSSVSQALTQMQKLSETLSPSVPIVDWR